MIKASRLNVIIFLMMFLAFAFISKLAALVGIRIAGLEYLIWFFFALFILTINIGLTSQRFILKSTYLILLSILLTICVVNYFFVDVPVIRYLQGTFFSFLFAFNFILFYNLKFEKEDFFFIAKCLIAIITTIAVSAYIERIFVEDEYPSFFLRGVSTIAKDPGFATTLFNINIIFCFALFLVERKKKYIYLICFSFITIALMLFIKAFVVSLIICFIFIRSFLKKNILKYYFYGIAILFFLLIVVAGKPLIKDITYKYSLYFGPGSERIPRNALYIASFEIARDYFPLGSGQGTFGSYPVGKGYSQIYYDYGLDKVHGLSYENALGLSGTQFVFDAYWSSIIGEMGFIAAFFYLWLWFFPALKSYRYLSAPDAESKAISFFVTMTIVAIFIESIAAPMPGQLQFIVIYAGLGAVGVRMLRQNLQ